MLPDTIAANWAGLVAVLLKPDDPDSLALKTTAFKHLIMYMCKVENLTPIVDGGSTPVGEAFDVVRSEVERFSTPTGLGNLIREDPEILAQPRPPEPFFAQIVWLIQRLHESAAGAASTLRGISAPTGSGEAAETGLELVENLADEAKSGIGPVSFSLKRFKPGILAANRGLGDAVATEAENLRRLQEVSGGFQVKIESMHRQLNNLGFFSSRQARENLEQQLARLNTESTANGVKAEKLRSTLNAAEPIVGEGVWLESGLDEISAYLDKIAEAWSTFGSAMRTLAGNTQARDPSSRECRVGLDEAISKWNAISAAAQRFVTEALVDSPPT